MSMAVIGQPFLDLVNSFPRRERDWLNGPLTKTALEESVQAWSWIFANSPFDEGLIKVCEC